MITLGAQPEQITVLIPRTGRFATALVNDEGDWPAGDTIELRFDGDGGAPITWSATINGPEARWDRTAADCAAVLALHRATAVLIYNAAGVEVLWGRGKTTGV